VRCFSAAIEIRILSMNERHLLVLDDEPEFAEYVRHVATNLGYEVQVASNGRTFQKLYHELQPSVIILDMVMPEMDGNEIVLWLTQQGYDASLIIISGYSLDYASDAKRLAEFKGLNSVTALSKPISVAELRSVLEEEAMECLVV
jgi:CheY-like chemotaxis protein